MLDSLHSLEPPGANQIRTQGESALVPNPGLSVSGPNSLSKRPFPHFQMQPSPQPAGVLPKHTRTLPCPSHLIPGHSPRTLQAPIQPPFLAQFASHRMNGSILHASQQSLSPDPLWDHFSPQQRFLSTCMSPLSELELLEG